MSKTVFLLTHIPNPRMNKRIAVAKELGDVFVVCIRRKTQNIWTPYYKDIEHDIIDIDVPSAAHVFNRAVVSKKYIKLFSEKLTKREPNVIYTAGLDALAAAVNYKKRNRACRIVYEVADLREAFSEVPKSLVKSAINSVIKNQEKASFRYVDNLVVTSEKFFDVHYKKIIEREKVLFIPNIPDAECFSKYIRKTEGPFTIGFIGGIRYVNQMKMLVDAAERVGCNVLFAGGGFENDYNDIQDYCRNMPFVKFTGQYDYARDIANLYGRVDCVYSVYDTSNANVRIALPNKLYESILCELPIIVAKGTYLSELVQAWGIGISVACDDVEELVCIIRQLIDDENMRIKFSEACKNNQFRTDKTIYDEMLYATLKNYL